MFDDLDSPDSGLNMVFSGVLPGNLGCRKLSPLGDIVARLMLASSLR